MTGWRLDSPWGTAQILAGLAVKQNVDSGCFQAVQYAGIAALAARSSAWPTTAGSGRSAGRPHRLAPRHGFAVAAPRATFYAWVPVPRGFTSSSFCVDLLVKAGVVVTPGNGFGASGEGFVRAAFTVNVERIREAMDRSEAGHPRRLAGGEKAHLLRWLASRGAATYVLSTPSHLASRAALQLDLLSSLSNSEFFSNFLDTNVRRYGGSQDDGTAELSKGRTPFSHG